MREVLAILNDRITVNSINGKVEAVSALQELREAILGPIQKAERDIFKALTRLELIEEAREGWARYEKGQAVETIKAVRQTLSE
jgi:hypothetical protein